MVIFDFTWDVRSIVNDKPLDRDRGRASETAPTAIADPVKPPYALGHLDNYAPQFWWSLDLPEPGSGTEVTIAGTVTWFTSAGTFEGEVDVSFIVR